MTDGPLFFDPDKARGPKPGPDVGRDVTGEILAGKESPAAAMTVSALIVRIKGALSDAFSVPVTVVGELSNVKRHGSGHLYFRLKDAGASIDAAMFRSAASRLRFRPEDGMEVVAEGRVDVYDVRGQLQFYVERMSPKGTGALELAFRQLREKLESEGLFEKVHKKPIPRFPRAVGIVTSATGAAIRDIRRTLHRRWPGCRGYLLGVLVQGEGAAAQIAEAVRLLDANAERLGLDTLIVARGGGSIEDLWAFNEEPVARAIFAARTPVISGVGHEVDVTIADLVADLRAPTPTAAAELAVENASDIAAHVAQLSARLVRSVRQQHAQGRSNLQAVLRSVVFRDPTGRLRTQMQRLDELSHRLRAGERHLIAQGRRRLEPSANRMAALHPARLADRARARVDSLTDRLKWVLRSRSKLAGDTLNSLASRLLAVHPRYVLRLSRQKIDSLHRQLEAMSYRNVLQRGFSVTRSSDGSILHSTTAVTGGQAIETELVDGKFTSVVQGATGAAADEKSPSKRKRPNRSDRDNPKLFD